MSASTRCLASLAAAATAFALAATAGTATARAATSCGIVTAGGHTWILVAGGVPCSTAKRALRGLAARTAGLRAGARATVTSPLPGFVCVVANRGKPAGSCATAGAKKSIVWISAT